MRATERTKQYLAIDLKSFYASVECAERGLDPLDAHLVVADESRTDKTICLAVSPALKAYGVPGRPRLFDVRRAVEEINRDRARFAPDGRQVGASASARELAADPALTLQPIVAKPRMAYYMDYSRRIVEIYLRHVSPEDLLIYSIDEVFIDATPYLKPLRLTAHDFAMKLIREVLEETGITATAGIGTNLYLAKVAMDIVAKHIPADADGVRIASLDERSYREKLWCHEPLTDFWRVGRGTAAKLEKYGIRTMGDIARCSEGADDAFRSEALLYRLFGVNAELLIDHAWGWEPAEIADCKAYTPESRSLNAGQVLQCAYPAEKGRIVVMEMADQLSMELVRKGLVSDQLVLDVIYDRSNLDAGYDGAVKADWYGRAAPKAAHGSRGLGAFTSSTDRIVEAAAALYDEIVDPLLTVRRFYVTLTHLLTEAEDAARRDAPRQLSFFDAPQAESPADDGRERRRQEAVLKIRERFGKNAIVKGLDLREGATAMERNEQIGGHKA